MKVLIICGLDDINEKKQTQEIMDEFGLRFDDLDITIINPSKDVVKEGIFNKRLQSGFQDYNFNDEKFDFIISGHCTCAGYQSLFTRETFKKIYNLLNSNGILILDMPFLYDKGKGPLYYIDLYNGLNVMSCFRLFFKEIKSKLNEEPMARYIFQKKKISKEEKVRGKICFEKSEKDFYIEVAKINKQDVYNIKFNNVLENIKDDFYISFYTNKIQNLDKVKLDDILRYNNKQLEDKHNFIQYLFPLETKSKYNPKAPIITDRFIKEAKKDKEIRSNIVRSFARMMNFYGFNIIKDSEGIHLEIDPKGDFQWTTRGNHNYMRISRMLTFLQMIDMHLLAYIFFDMLCKLYQKGKIEKDTFEVWKEIIR